MAKRTLIVGPSWVGDMVMAQALYRLLKQRDRDTEIDVLAPAWSLGVLARMPEVSRGIELPVGHGELGLAKRWRAGRRLRGRGYSRAIVLPRSAKAALVPLFAGVRQRVGYLGEMRYGLINDRRQRPEFLNQTVKRFCWLGLEAEETALPELPRPALQADTNNQGRLVEHLGLTASARTVALLPGAEYGPAKQWPVERFRALAGVLQEHGAAVWILGSERERELGEQIRGNTEGVVNLCGRTSLEDVIDVLSLCDAAVSNDSGLMHVAAAVGTHVVAIYGSSSPDFTPPLTSRSAVLWLNLECSPCFERTCPLNHLNCLNGIEVPMVLGSLREAGLL